MAARLHSMCLSSQLKRQREREREKKVREALENKMYLNYTREQCKYLLYPYMKFTKGTHVGAGPARHIIQ